MEDIKYGCGIDIAKDKFDCCLSAIRSDQQVSIRAQSSFPNTINGFAALIKWARKHSPLPIPIVFLMEATGIYYEQLAWYLHTQDCNLTVVLANKAKKYKDSLGLKSKNDRIDARGLAQMCCEQAHTAWRPLSKNLYTLRTLTREMESLAAQKTATTNRLKAMQHGMFRDKKTEQMLQQQLDMYARQKRSLEQRVEVLIAADPELNRKFEQILPIKGLGLQTLAVIVAETAGFAAFENAAQLVSYAGYDIVENQSGNRTGKTKISKKGNSRIRRAMHFAAFNMIRYEVGGMAAFYQRIFERTRIKMKAYTAVQKKLLTIIYALWKKDEAYNPQHMSKTSGDTETAPSLATAGEPAEKAVLVGAVVKEVIPAIKSGITQDRHPSTRRRMPSLAETNLPT